MFDLIMPLCPKRFLVMTNVPSKSRHNNGSTGESVPRPFPTKKIVKSDSKRKNVVLLACGSFNPPTIMHLRMFELARDHLIQDGCQVIAEYVSPVNDAYGKEDLVPSGVRLQMLQECAAESETLMVDDWEASQPEAQRSLAVLQRVQEGMTQHMANLQLENSEFEVRLLCGSDLLESMLTPGIWLPDQISTILKDFGVISISRHAKHLAEQLAADSVMGQHSRAITIIEDPWHNNLSSSLVRCLVRKGQSIKYLVPGPASKYLLSKRLYI